MIDAFALLIVTSGDPLARASVAVKLVEVAYATVASLTEAQGQTNRGASALEPASLHHILFEIWAHRDRMALAQDPQASWTQPG